MPSVQLVHKITHQSVLPANQIVLPRRNAAVAAPVAAVRPKPPTTLPAHFNAAAVLQRFRS
jgi:hypothetical protein